MRRRPYGWFLSVIGALLAQMVSLHNSVGSAEPNLPGDQERTIELLPLVTEDLESPVSLTHARDGSGRLFVVEQPGRIRIVERGVLLSLPFLDIRDRILAGGERGLLGLAFHPDFRRNGKFYLNYTRKPDGATVVAEYRRGPSPNQALGDERVLMTVPQPYANHNGGMVAFGPDGYLYIGLGDGGSGGDPENRAQNPGDLLGKILRIDVNRGDPYGIPSDNPFASEGGRPEIYAMGLRNPWRFSFDMDTGDLWAADVGQHKWEEIDLIVRGGNYGWRVKEGRHCYAPALFCENNNLTAPVLEYAHDKGRCSIIGGYVYRGRGIAGLGGQYLYGDYCSGEIFAFTRTQERKSSPAPRVILKTAFRISSFGEDEIGELYALDHGGSLYRIAPPKAGQ
jgi:glucose/arabinose dehydrogenase